MPALRVLLTTLVLLSCDAATPAVWHVYRVGDETLSHIARKTGVSVTRLEALNQLEGRQLHWGQGLLVPHNDKTAALPRWRPAQPGPELRECTELEWVPVVAQPADAHCLDRVCAGEVCVCRTTAGEPEVEVQFGAASWGAAVFPSLEPAVGSLQHVKVDLDGDGQRESVVSVREGVSNGVAIEWWKHVVVSRGRPVVSFSTADSGHAFVSRPRGCALLAVTTDWRTDQLRGDGLYFVAQQHVLEGDALRAVGPELARRYTHRFAAQRWESLETAPVHVVPWFSDVGAFVWPAAPTEPRCRTSTVLREEEDSFELAGLGTWSPRAWHEGDAPPTGEYDTLLDAKTGARLLDDYRPFGEASWAGRQVTVCEGVVDGEPRVSLAF